MKVLYNDGHVGEINDAAEELEVIRHDAAHLLAQALKRLYPHAQFAYGPATETVSTMTLILETLRLTRTISQLSKMR